MRLFRIFAAAILFAFAAVTADAAVAATQAMLVMGVAGEMAAERAEGPGSLQMHFLDALYRLSKEDLRRRARLERAQLVLESDTRPALQALLTALMPELYALKAPRELRWHIDVDPGEL
jgi:primosomal protein N'